MRMGTQKSTHDLVKWCCVGIVLVIFARIATVVYFEGLLQTPPPFFPVEKSEVYTMIYWFQFFYMPTYMRLGTLLFGVLLAYLHVFGNGGLSPRSGDPAGAMPLSNGMLANNSRRAGGSVDSSSLAQASFAWRFLDGMRTSFLLRWAVMGSTFFVLFKHRAFTPSFFFSVFLWIGSPLFALAVCCVIYISLNRIGTTGRILHKFFVADFWTPIANLSYIIYLLHSSIITKLYTTVFYQPQFLLWSILQYFAVVLPLCLLTSAVIYVLVERPAGIWLSQRGPAAATVPVPSSGDGNRGRKERED